MIWRYWRQRVSWLWLSLMSFSVMLILNTYEARWVYPEIHRYFGYAGDLTGQQLATRARVYLQDGWNILLDGEADENAMARVSTRLELTYSLLDIAVYRDGYDCTNPSLKGLDTLSDRLANGERLDPVSASRAFMPLLQCLTEIEMGQQDARSATATAFAKEARRHQHLVLAGSMLIYVVGMMFWWMHVRQRRAAEQATQEKLHWMAQAMRDPLTGVGNRSALYDDCLTRTGLPSALLLIDIDYFKQYNDALGHPEGDQLLRRLVVLIDEALGHQAILYRMGGDEFAALVDCPDEASLYRYCHELMQHVHSAGLPHPDHPDTGQVTLSLGACLFDHEPVDFAACYAAADQALYRVKSEGRNGFRIAGRVARDDSQ